MSQSLVQIYVHLVFSTKHRQPFLNEAEFRQQAHAYLAGTCNNLESPALKVGGVADHVHILCRLGKTLDVAKLIRELKRESSKWVKQERPRLADFHWQSGYGAFSISPGHVAGLTKYIADQEEHHRHESFQDEFRRLCRKYGVAIDSDMFGTNDAFGTFPYAEGVEQQSPGSAQRRSTTLGNKAQWQSLRRRCYTTERMANRIRV